MDNNALIEAYKKEVADLPKGCIAETGKNVVFDPRALEKMVQSDGVVLVEKIGGSRYENIGNELETIKKYGVDVLGVVVLEWSKIQTFGKNQKLRRIERCDYLLPAKGCR